MSIHTAARVRKPGKCVVQRIHISQVAIGWAKVVVIKTIVTSKSRLLNFRCTLILYSNDIQLDLDAYGDSHSLCSITGRSKSLCCDSPVSSNPFLPVELADVFPTLPANADVPEWDLIGLGLPFNTGQGAGTVNNQGFGFVLIDGPKSAVTSLSKRDGSDYEFLDCPTGTERQTVRIFCNTDIAGHSNCHEIFEGGVEGTVIKLPDNCGPGTYAVAHSLTVSEQQVRILNLLGADIHPLS